MTRTKKRTAETKKKITNEDDPTFNGPWLPNFLDNTPMYGRGKMNLTDMAEGKRKPLLSYSKHLAEASKNNTANKRARIAARNIEKRNNRMKEGRGWYPEPNLETTYPPYRIFNPPGLSKEDPSYMFRAQRMILNINRRPVKVGYNYELPKCKGKKISTNVKLVGSLRMNDDMHPFRHAEPIDPSTDDEEWRLSRQLKTRNKNDKRQRKYRWPARILGVVTRARKRKVREGAGVVTQVTPASGVVREGAGVVTPVTPVSVVAISAENYDDAHEHDEEEDGTLIVQKVPAAEEMEEVEDGAIAIRRVFSTAEIENMDRIDYVKWMADYYANLPAKNIFAAPEDDSDDSFWSDNEVPEVVIGKGGFIDTDNFNFHILPMVSDPIDPKCEARFKEHLLNGSHVRELDMDDGYIGTKDAIYEINRSPEWNRVDVDDMDDYDMDCGERKATTSVRSPKDSQGESSAIRRRSNSGGSRRQVNDENRRGVRPQVENNLIRPWIIDEEHEPEQIPYAVRTAVPPMYWNQPFWEWRISDEAYPTAAPRMTVEEKAAWIRRQKVRDDIALDIQLVNAPDHPDVQRREAARVIRRQKETREREAAQKQKEQQRRKAAGGVIKNPKDNKGGKNRHDRQNQHGYSKNGYGQGPPKGYGTHNDYQSNSSSQPYWNHLRTMHPVLALFSFILV